MKNKLPEVLKSKTPKVFKNKKLNVANFGDFTRNDYQVFLHLVSKIGGVDKYGKYLQPEQLQREHILTAKEFGDLFDTDIHNSYKFLYKACKKLMKTSIILEKIELNETWEINICSTAKYNKREGSITIEFTDRIMPYLAQVRQKFVLYNLKEISKFKSIYTTRLYELLQEFQETGYMIKSVVQLRDAFAVGNKFKAYRDFKVKTFNHACQEININYNMDLRFEEIKEGRKVVAIKFFFKKAMVHQVINQKTRVTRNIYDKPKPRQKIKNNNKSEALKDKLVDSKTDQKPIKNVVSSLLTKIFQKK